MAEILKERITTNIITKFKTLFVIRHAKSSWNNLVLTDFDRPLNDRGKNDAPEMANRLLNKNILIDAFVSSPAERAKQTAELFCTIYKKDAKEIIFAETLYHAPAKDFYPVIENIDNQFSSIALYSHNTGLTDFVNELVDNVRIDNVPTCGIFGITILTDNWKNFATAKKELLFFDYPKNNK